MMHAARIYHISVQICKGIQALQSLTALTYLDLRLTLLDDFHLGFLRGLQDMRCLIIHETHVHDTGMLWQFS